MNSKRQYLQAMRERYRHAGGRAAKAGILDEVVEATGCHRKHAIRAIRAPKAAAHSGARRGRPKKYLVCLSAIERIWVALDYCCAERLHPQLLPLAHGLVRHRELEAPLEVLDELARISRASLARRLAEMPRP